MALRQKEKLGCIIMVLTFTYLLADTTYFRTK
jgi:hypothetical protein